MASTIKIIITEPLFLYVTSSAPSLLTADINGEELEISGGSPGSYDICLTAIDNNGGLVSNAFVVKVNNSTSTRNHSLPDLDIYPNPVNDLLHISTTTSAFNITIYNPNSSFKKSYKNLVDSVSVDLSDLPLGVYFVRVENPINGAFSIKKIIRL